MSNEDRFRISQTLAPSHREQVFIQSNEECSEMFYCACTYATLRTLT